MREQLFKAKNAVWETIDVPVWGKTYLRHLGMNEVSHFNEVKEDATKACAYLVSVGVCDENGQRVFTDDDIPSILDLPGKIVFPIGMKLCKAIGANFEQVEDKKKDSEPITTADLNSDLQDK